ncbi:MAG: hypothetical protein ACRCX5_14510 [Bacteroidales bacterium]
MKNLKLLRTSSKKALMDSAIFVCDGNYQKAGELYDLYVSRMDLPDFDPVPVSGFDKAKDTAVSLFGWLKENQGEVMGVIDFVKNIRSGGGGGLPPTAPPNLPPL